MKFCTKSIVYEQYSNIIANMTISQNIYIIEKERSPTTPKYSFFKFANDAPTKEDILPSIPKPP